MRRHSPGERKIPLKYSKKGFFIIILGLALRLLYTLHAALKDPLFYQPIMDPLYHHQWAQSIIRGGWLNDLPYFRAPLYPYMLALFYFLFGPHLLIPRLVGAVLGASSCYLVYLIGRALFSEKTGFYAGIVTCVYPVLIYFDGELLIPSLLIFLILLGVLFLIRQRLFLAGIFLGLASITRPNVLVFALILILYFLAKRQRVVLLTIGLLIPIIPVTVRNYIKSGEIIPIAWQGGINFYIGNNPESDGITAVIPGTRKDWWGGYYDARKIAQEALGREPSYEDIDQYWFTEGLKFIIKNPLSAFRLYLKKIYLLAGGYEISNNRSIYFFKDFTFLKYLILFMPFLQIPFGLLVPFAVVGICDRIRKKKDTVLLIFLIAYAASFLPFFINARFRAPLIPFLILFAVHGAFHLVEALKKRQFTPLYIFIPVLIFLNLNLMGLPPTNLARDHLTLAGVYLQQGKPDSASEEAKKSIKYNDLAEAHNLLGQIYNMQGEYASALNEFQLAIQQNQTLPDPYINIGNHYARSGRLDAALHYFQQAKDLDPYNARLLNSMGNIYFSTGNREEAERHYLMASQLEPDYLSPLYHLALLYLKTGRKDAALELYQQMVSIDPGSEMVRHLNKQLSGQ